jgi:hypothetical protein
MRRGILSTLWLPITAISSEVDLNASLRSFVEMEGYKIIFYTKFQILLICVSVGVLDEYSIYVFS